MKKVVLCAVSIGLLALLFAGCTGQPKPSAEPTPTVGVAVPAKTQSGSQVSGRQIIAEGQVVPVRSAALGLPSAGAVISVPVTLGAQVKAGDILAQLDTRQLELQLAEAGANVAVAQAKLDQFNQGPAAQDVAAAQQNVASAQAAYDKVHAGPAAPDVASAQAALSAAQKNYVSVRAGPSAEKLLNLAAQRDNARAARDQAQAAFDRIKGAPDAGARPESLQLQQATNNFNAADAAYKDAQGHPTDAELAAAHRLLERIR